MKTFTGIINDYRNAIINNITLLLKERGGVISLKHIIGGKDGNGFGRKTLLLRVTIITDMFEGEKVTIVIKGKNGEEFIDFNQLSLDEIAEVCQAIDFETMMNINKTE